MKGMLSMLVLAALALMLTLGGCEKSNTTPPPTPKDAGSKFKDAANKAGSAAQDGAQKAGDAAADAAKKAQDASGGK